ncbi:cell shape determination protein CcmA [Candidatus Bipolaricaulota bacterium]|nr:cell shape determination protein CcmA [Candidatus Bipolaricaulota bacterium]
MSGNANDSERDKRGSASISGAGTIGGGSYERVSISGSGKITGDLTADEIKISGSGKIQGLARVIRVSTSGSAVFEAGIVADEVRISGSARSHGTTEIKELKCSGVFKTDGSLKSEYIKISGSLTVDGDVSSEIYKTTGAFRIGGLLSADHIEINLAGRCEAREIGGERIEVRRGGWRQKGLILDGLISIFTGGSTSHLRSELIEGDTIHLEDTEAEIVRGKHVFIGPGCNIKTVEYSEDLAVDEDAKVEHEKNV